MPPMDRPPIDEDPVLACTTRGSRATTLGLSVRGHPELELAIADAGQAPEARALLTALAAEVVSRGRALSPGERLEWGDSILEARVAVLVVYELDLDTGQWQRGAPRLLTRLTQEE